MDLGWAGDKWKGDKEIIKLPTVCHISAHLPTSETVLTFCETFTAQEVPTAWRRNKRKLHASLAW